MIVMTIKRSIWCLRHLLLACMRRYDEKHHPPDAFTAAYTDIFFPFSPGCDQDYTCSGTWRMRQPELLHSLTVKLAETFLALRQAEEGKKKTGCSTSIRPATRWSTRFHRHCFKKRCWCIIIIIMRGRNYAVVRQACLWFNGRPLKYERGL